MALDITLYRGCYEVVTCTATKDGSAINLTGATIRFTVRRSYPASTVVSDADAIMTKTTANDIAITTPASGIFTITFDKADTNGLKAGKYLCGAEYVAAGETDPRILDQGVLTILPDIVRT